jgi:predicted MFS family arabinose efflux permease
VGQASVETISLILLGFGIANFVGTSLPGICWHVICA